MDQIEIPAVVAHEEDLARQKAEHEAAVEQECVEQVFGLTGGELEDKPWDCKDGHGFKYWYEGVPDYLGRQHFPDVYDVTYRTVVYCGNPPEVLEDEDGRWFRAGFWGSSGETECPWSQADECEDREERPCELCEAQEGEEHGHIYVGDGWCEAVYKQDPVREVLES